MISSWLKKHLAAYLLLAFFLYLVAGAAAPFFRSKSVAEDTKEAIQTADFYQDEPSCDRAMLLETNQSAWDERMRLMSLARKRIILSTFDFRDGESPRDIMSVLLHKAQEGVKVQILVDGFSGLVRMEPNKLFYALSSHPNVEIKIYNKMSLLIPWTSQGRMHDKYVIVDDYGYILGGRNTFDYFIGSYPTNSRSHDREVLVYNTAHGTEKGKQSSLYQVESYFNQVWNLKITSLFHDREALAQQTSIASYISLLEARYEDLAASYPTLLSCVNCQTPEEQKPELNGSSALSYYQTHTVPTGKITLVSNPTTIYSKEPVVFYTLTHLMKNAKKDVTIHTPYAVFNDDMYRTMTEVAARVPVTMMLNSVENGDNFFASSDYPRHKKQFIRTGMTIYEYDGGLSYHGKSVVIDDELCAVGSYNFDLRSTYLDTELMLVIQSPQLTKELSGYMDSYQADCRRLLADGSYEIPEHVTVAPVPLYKRIAWSIVGFVMQPFRFLI